MWTRQEPSAEPVRKIRYLSHWKLWALAVSFLVGLWTDYASYAGGDLNAGFRWSDGIGYCALGLSSPLYLLACSAAIILARSTADLAVTNAWEWCRVGGELWILLKIGYHARRYVNRQRSEYQWEQEHQADLAPTARRQEQTRQQLATEREALLRCNQGAIVAVELLVASCRAPFEELALGLQALKGREVISFYDAVWSDMAKLFVRFGKVSNGPSASLVRLLTVISLALGFDDDESTQRAATTLTLMNVEGEFEPPGVVALLSFYDCSAKHKTAFAAASSYRQLAVAGFEASGGQVAAKMVLDAYLETLVPYLQEEMTEKEPLYNHGNLTLCQECRDGLKLLDLPHDCTIDDVASKRRALTEVLHPDRLGEKNHKTRSAAERQLMAVNAASDHLSKCQHRARPLQRR